MTKFLSSHEKQIDAKGRVSVPAAYRAELEKQGSEVIYCFPSLNDDNLAVECYPQAEYDAIVAVIPRIEDAEDRELMEWAVVTRCQDIHFDAEGRATFPERFLKYCGIEKAVVFAARGNRFQIMSPENFARVDGGVGRSLSKLRNYVNQAQPAQSVAQAKPEVVS